MHQSPVVPVSGRSPHPASRRASAPLLALVLFLTLPRGARAEASLAYKYQDYQEADDRIRVKNHNVRASVDLGTQTRLSVRGVIDAISGATPTGQPAPVGSDDVPLTRMEDERRAAVLDVAHTRGVHTLGVQYTRSEEDDYISDGYAASWAIDFNEKNTQLQLAFAYNDDRIQPVFFSAARKKATRDLMAGLVQVIDADTVLTVNLTHGTASGYLSDPYKIVQKDIEIVPGFPLPLTFAEHRPDSRRKTILFAQIARHVAKLRGSLEASVRFYTDSHGIDSDTVEAAWFQKLGERVVLSPSLRFYRQGQADFYHARLDGTPIVPVAVPVAGTPHYSSDYRLSKFDATTLGLKLVYLHDGRWSADIAYERYEMRGRDRVTPRRVYPTADIVTVGLHLWF